MKLVWGSLFPDVNPGLDEISGEGAEWDVCDGGRDGAAAHVDLLLHQLLRDAEQEPQHHRKQPQNCIQTQATRASVPCHPPAKLITA